MIKKRKRLYGIVAILVLLSNVIFAPIASASMEGGGSFGRTVYGLNYDMQMNIHSSGNRADPSFPVYAGGEGYFRLVNTYPGTNKKTVKNSTYTITVPESIDFSTIKNISLIGENGRQFTGNGYDWLNADYSKYLMDTSLYAIISDEETRTITVTIPNTNDWTSINSTCFEFTYRVPSNAEGNLNWKTSVYSSGATYETTDTMVLYHDVIIHHVDNEGKPVYENTVVTEKFGTEIKASSYIKNIEGYTYDCVQGETSAIIDSDIKELTLVYNKKIVAGGNITIKYVDEEGNAIAGIADKTITGNIGESYDSTTPEYQISIPGYHLDRENLPDNMTGEFIDQAQEVTYTYIKDKTAVNVHDSTLYVGEDWTAEDNFDSAIDKDGNPVDFQNITVSGSVDTSKADTYEVTYSYEGVESKATITVKDKQTAVNVHDSTLYVGEDWTAEDNFDSAIDKDGNPVDFQNIMVSGSVDTSKADTYEVTYSYEGVESKAIVTVLGAKEDLAHITVHDSTLKVGDEWLPEDNFDEARDFEGNIEVFSDIIVEGNVDTTKAGTYEVTYSIPEEHWGRSTVEGDHSATAKIVVTEEDTDKDGSDNNGGVGGEESQDKDKGGDSNINTDISDKEESKVLNQTLPQTGENETLSYLTLISGITLLISGLILSILRFKKVS